MSERALPETLGPTKFRKVPVAIDAWQLTSSNGKKVAEWCGAEWVHDGSGRWTAFLLIKTLEGTHRADLGDYIIKGVKGEFYPCKPQIFAMTYERVT